MEQTAKLKNASQFPLTDNEISLMANNADSGDWNSLIYHSCWLRGYKEGVRDAEITHGIGK